MPGPRRVSAGYGDFQGFGGFEDIFESFFGGGMRTGAARRGPARGADLRYDLQSSLRKRSLAAKRRSSWRATRCATQCQGSGAEPGTQPIRCPQCNGTGEVRRQQQTILGSFVQVTTCPRCQGEREIVTTPCTKCRGRKVVQSGALHLGQDPGRRGRWHPHPPGR